jgi:hypothetical protein
MYQQGSTIIDNDVVIFVSTTFHKTFLQVIANYVLCLPPLLFKGLTSRLVFKVFKTMDFFNVCKQA